MTTLLHDLELTNLEFTEIKLSEELSEDTYKITIGDLNGDGYLEIVEANSQNMNLYYRTVVKK